MNKKASILYTLGVAALMKQACGDDMGMMAGGPPPDMMGAGMPSGAPGHATIIVMPGALGGAPGGAPPAAGGPDIAALLAQLQGSSDAPMGGDIDAQLPFPNAGAGGGPELPADFPMDDDDAGGPPPADAPGGSPFPPKGPPSGPPKPKAKAPPADDSGDDDGGDDAGGDEADGGGEAPFPPKKKTKSTQRPSPDGEEG